jgi:hypothetical protein
MIIPRGNKKRINIACTLNKAALDITNCTLLFTVKRDQSTAYASAEIKKSVTAHDNASLGLTHVDLTGSDTMLDCGEYAGFLTLVDATGGRITYKTITVVIEPSEQ